MYSGNNSEVARKLFEYYNIDLLPSIIRILSDYEINSFYKFRYEYPSINEENLDTWIANLLSSNILE